MSVWIAKYFVEFYIFRGGGKEMTELLTLEVFSDYV
jgi:hypothetical protein